MSITMAMLSLLALIGAMGVESDRYRLATYLFASVAFAGLAVLA